MKQLTSLLLATIYAVTTAVAASYSTEATLSLQKDEGTYKLAVVVSQLDEQDGKLAEHVIARPCINSAPGVPASAYIGLQPANPDYTNQENVTVDATWPYPSEPGTASCTVTIKRGDQVVSRSRLRLQVDGPGRTPLIVTAQDVSSRSVRVVEEKSDTFVFFEFTGKTRAAVKKLAVENYGNKVRIRDANGHETEAGLSFGTYQELGLALQYNSKAQAEQIAGILRGTHPPTTPP